MVLRKLVFLSVVSVFLFGTMASAFMNEGGISVDLRECRDAKEDERGERAGVGICTVVQSVAKKRGNIFSLRAFIKNEDGSRIPYMEEGRAVFLRVTDRDKRIIGDGIMQSGKYEVRGSLDRFGMVDFDDLFLPSALPNGSQLMVEVDMREPDNGDIGYTRYVSFPIVAVASGLASMPLYGEIETLPPAPFWALSYDGVIPANTIVRWYMKDERKGDVMSGEEFSTVDSSSSLTVIGKKGEAPGQLGCYTLVVAIDAPVSLVTASRMGCVLEREMEKDSE